ncbi:hypothetical protein U9M48_036349 [Paspalum notatum var. saurae]|uniref:Uncharacterized protein n=1 Tax=Paspalum notatum var. saurae TaxID=547442 RepID=A0AAQ3X9Z3_PASNO
MGSLGQPKTGPKQPKLTLIFLSLAAPPLLVAPPLSWPPLPFLLMRKQKEGAAMSAPLPHGCPLSSLHSPHHRNMKTECSYHKEDDPLLRFSIHALKDAMEVASLLLPLLSMGVETMESTPTIPDAEARLQPYGIVCAAASPP